MMRVEIALSYRIVEAMLLSARPYSMEKGTGSLASLPHKLQTLFKQLYHRLNMNTFGFSENILLNRGLSIKFSVFF